MRVCERPRDRLPAQLETARCSARTDKRQQPGNRGPMLKVGLPGTVRIVTIRQRPADPKLIYQSSTLSKDGLSKGRVKAYQPAQGTNDAFRSARAYSGQTRVFEVKSKSSPRCG